MNGRTAAVESRHQQVLNLAIPQAYAQVRDQLSEILRRYEIDYLKWDHNRDLVDAGSAGSGRPAVHAQTLAAYRLMDELRAVRPGLEIESCASGGARVDLEVLQRTDRVWASDCIDALELQQIDWWTKQLIPPELVGSHIASVPFHTTGRILGLPMRAATAVFGHLGIEWDITQAGPEELAVLKEWIDWHKQHRALLHRGRMVRLDWPTMSSACTAWLTTPAESSRSRWSPCRGRWVSGCCFPVWSRRPATASRLSSPTRSCSCRRRGRQHRSNSAVPSWPPVCSGRR